MEQVYFEKKPRHVSVVRELGGWRTDVVMDVRKLAGDELQNARDDGLLGDGVEELWTGVPVLTLHHDTTTPDVAKIKKAIVDYINSRTDEKILSGFVWEGKRVWLSTENQFNFKAAYDLAVQLGGANLPIKFKLGEDADGIPVYHTFRSMNAFTEFYTGAIGYIQRMLTAGWTEKDTVLQSINELTGEEQ